MRRDICVRVAMCAAVVSSCTGIALAQPANNACGSAAAIPGYGATVFDTGGATNDGPLPSTCDSGNDIGSDVWFTYTACASGDHTLSTCGASYDTTLVAYTGGCGALVQVACNDDSNTCGAISLQSSMTWAAVAGTQYRIRLGGYQGATGSGTLTLTGPLCPPANDNCGSATALSAYGDTAFGTFLATTDGPGVNNCDTGNQIGNDVWFTYTACSSGDHTVSTCSSTFDTVLLVYTGNCGSLAQVSCNDDACGDFALRSSITWAATAGTQYRIRIGGFQGEVGTGTLSLSGPDCGSNACAGATPISAYGATLFGTNGATTDGPAVGDCGFGNDIANDVWFSYTACTNGDHTVDTCTSTFDTVVLVYTGDCGALAQVGCSDDSSTCGPNSLQSSMTWTALAGTQYRIRIGGYQGATGLGTLTLTGPVCGPVNDFCATGLSVSQGSTAFSTIGATTDGPGHGICSNAGSDQVTNDLWYRHVSATSGSIAFRVCNNGYDTRLAIYDDAGCGNYEARLLGCDDDSCGMSGLGSAVRIAALAGRTYTIRVGGFEGAVGAGVLDVNYCPADFDASGNVDVPDIFAFLSAWFSQNPRASYDGAPGIAVPDIFAFLSAWFAGGGPCS